jgi:hypothetical protein
MSTAHHPVASTGWTVWVVFAGVIPIINGDAPIVVKLDFEDFLRPVPLEVVEQFGIHWLAVQGGITWGG